MMMSHDPVDNALDHACTRNWALAMGLEPSAVFNYPGVDNVLQYSIASDNWFAPDLDDDGRVIDNQRLEWFRKAAVYANMSNLTDLAIYLDDDYEATVAHSIQLMSPDKDANGNPLWLVDPADVTNVVIRTFR